MKKIFLYSIILFICASCAVGPKKRSKNQAATASSPTEQALLAKAQNSLRKNHITSARSILTGLTQKNPNSEAAAEAYFLLGQIDYNKKNYRAAYKSFIHIINSKLSSKKEGVAYYKAARSLEKIGQVDEAIALADSGIQRSDVHKEHHIQLQQLKVRLHTDLGNNIEALRSALFISQQHSKTSFRDKYRVKAQSIAELKLNKDELEKISSDSDFASLHPYIKYRVGQNYFQNGQYSKAKSKLEDVISASPGSALADKAQALIVQMNARSRVRPQTIGVILPLSGRHSHVAKKTLKGLQLGLGIFGTNRSTLKLAVIDSAANADTARKAVQRLVTEDNVIGIVGGLLSKTSPTISAKANELGIPNITLSQKSRITDNGDYVFQNALTSKEQVRTIVKTAMGKMKFKKFAVLYPNDNYGIEFANLFWDEVKAQGGEITAAQTYVTKETDFNGTIKRLVGTYYVENRKSEYKLLLTKWLKDKKSISSRSEPPENLLPPIIDFEAIFIPDNTKALGQIAPMLAFHDVDDITLLGTNLWNTPSLIRRGSRYVDGAVFVDSLLAFKENLKGSEFYKNYKQSFDEEPNKFSAQAYDAGLMFRQAISAGESTRTGLRQYLQNLDKFHGSAGVLNSNRQREFNYPTIELTVKGNKIIKL